MYKEAAGRRAPMTAPPRNGANDLRGLGRMAVDATLGITDLVEELHARIARLPVRASGPIGAAVAGTTDLVYRGVRGVTRVVGSGLDGVLGRLVPLLDDVADTPARDQLVAALNGVLGDYLARSDNPLAIPLAMRRDGAPLVLERNALSAAFPLARSTVVVAVHGLCMNDRQWTRKGHDHGIALARDLDATLLRLHYNSGRHVHETGRDFAAALDALVDEWPVPIDRLHLLGHSMGGLVARSAAHVGALENQRWRRTLATIACLGNIGPGFNQVGPMANFADLHPVSRVVLTLAMWIGRLEVLTVLVILRPEVWRSGQWSARPRHAHS